MRGQRHASAVIYPRERPGTHYTGGWVDPRVRKISPPPGFDPRTVQPVASSYTDYATRPTHDILTINFKAVFHETTWTRLNLRFLHLWSNTTHENCALLDYCTASSGNFLPTFRDNLSVPSSMVRKPSPQKKLILKGQNPILGDS